MLYKVDVLTSRGSLISLPFGDTSGGYEVRDIQGLDPVKAVLASASSQTPASQLADRNITMQVGFAPDYLSTSVRTLRHNLYSFFQPQSNIDLTFYDDEGLTVHIAGRVESFEAPLFTDKPQANISILCFNPDTDFLGITPVVISSESTADPTVTTITYDGSINAGFLFTLNVDRSITEATIYNRGPDGILTSMDFSGSLVSADVLRITTITGSKSAMVTKWSGTISSILYGISPQSIWFPLQPGDNDFRVDIEGDPIPYTVTYTERYGGL